MCEPVTDKFYYFAINAITTEGTAVFHLYYHIFHLHYCTSPLSFWTYVFISFAIHMLPVCIK